MTGDSQQDILSGCYSAMDAEPMAGYFWLLAGQKNGTVAKPEVVKGSDGKPLVVPGGEDVVKSICTQPAAHDWDGDGDLDIMTGNFEGTYWLFRNDGTKGKASWNPKATPVMGPDGPLRLPSAHSALCPVDFDGDGDTDIVSGSSNGGAYWAENTAGPKGEPEFRAFKELLAPPANAHGDSSDVPGESAPMPTAPGSDTRVWVADVNGDAKPDLLIGDTHRLRSRAKGVSAEEFKKRQHEWNRELSAIQDEVSRASQAGQPLPDELQKKYSAHYAKQADFVKQESTGFVWVMRGQ